MAFRIACCSHGNGGDIDDARMEFQVNFLNVLTAHTIHLRGVAAARILQAAADSKENNFFVIFLQVSKLAV